MNSIKYTLNFQIDPSKLAKENTLLSELVHINTLLLDIELERRRVQNVILQTGLPDLSTEILDKNKDLIEQLNNRKQEIKLQLAH